MPLSLFLLRPIQRYRKPQNTPTLEQIQGPPNSTVFQHSLYVLKFHTNNPVKYYVESLGHEPGTIAVSGSITSNTGAYMHINYNTPSAMQCVHMVERLTAQGYNLDQAIHVVANAYGIPARDILLIINHTKHTDKHGDI